MTTRFPHRDRAGRRAVPAGAIAGVAGLAAAADVLPGQTAPKAAAATTGSGPSDWLDVVQDFSAPTNGTNAAPAIQAAIDACPPGGVV